MDIINRLISIKIKNRIKQITHVLENPFETQSQLLIKQLNFAKNTLYGQKHRFSEINNYNTFCEKIPISDYDKLKQYITLSQRYNKNILWPGKIKWYAKSSGTTSEKSKYIPISNESIYHCHFKAGKDMLAIYLNNYPQSKILNGKSLMIGGSTNINYNTGYSIGDLSAIIIKNLPIWVQLKQTPSTKTALLNDWEQKINAIFEETRNKNITSISGVPSWTIVILNKIINKLKIKHLNEIWPNLELYMHGGINFETYKRSFKKLISNNIHYLELYNASEGFFAIQNETNKKDLMLLLNHGVFYEFIPVKNGKEYEDQIIPLNKVKLGIKYSMVITTNGGLWRYKIGDVIYFTSTNPFKIKIYGRTKNYINAFGEELMVNNANTAINITSIKTQSIVNEYSACPKFYSDNTGCHEWFIEFKNEPKNILEFINILDEELKKTNSDYEAKRYNNILLKKPIIRIVKLGSFHKRMKLKGKIGGQNKIPRLQNNRKFIEQLIPYL